VITVIDYKAGNLASVRKAIAHLGESSELVDTPEAIAKAQRLLLPGVGNFSSTERIFSTGMAEAIREAITRGAPFMGICVGMQWLYQGSTEAPESKGLGLFDGMVERFQATELKVPHVGWNTLEIRENSRLFAGVDRASFVYFTHSYRAPIGLETAAVTTYGEGFAAAVERDNVFATQFHPEKSGAAGLKILENFLRWEGSAC